MPHYKLVDCLTQGYLGLVGVLVLLCHGEAVPSWQAVVLGHALVLTLVHGLIVVADARGTPVLRLLRTFYPLLLFTFLYVETHHLDRMFFSESFDSWLVDLDQRLFGEQLSRTLMARFPSILISEVLYAAYFSYYVMVAGVAIGLYAVDRGKLSHYLTTVSLVFYACYLAFILFPVMGPHATETGITWRGAIASIGPRSLPQGISSGVFFRVMAEVYDRAEPAGGGAFPSSHVAVAVTTLVYSWRCWPRVRWIHLGATVLLCIATVYCGYHYAVDVFAGLLVALLLVPVASWLLRRFGNQRGSCP